MRKPGWALRGAAGRYRTGEADWQDGRGRLMGNMTDDDVTAAEGGLPAARPTPKVPMRERIVEAATALFYAQGLRAVSAEKIIAQVGITKVTFYRHFPTKDDLIVAYLERRAKWERDAIAQAREAAGDAPGVFRILAEAIGAESCSPGFRGCPFINAAAEYADPEHPVRRVVDAHRRWFRQTIQDLLDEINVPDSAQAADQLVMLRDGAMVSGYLSDPSAVADALDKAFRAVIAFNSA
jgi:AcrR family transcriptional regulator